MAIQIKDGDDEKEGVDAPVVASKSPTHVNLYAQGAIGGFMANYHFHMSLYRDVLTGEGAPYFGGDKVDISKAVIQREILATIYMSPRFTKELAKWLTKSVERYEKDHGEIPLGAVKPAHGKPEKTSDG
jgi:hypothetical protein